MSKGALILAYAGLILGLLVMLGGCSTSDNAWDTAGWEYGYTPQAAYEPEERSSMR